MNKILFLFFAITFLSQKSYSDAGETFPLTDLKVRCESEVLVANNGSYSFSMGKVLLNWGWQGVSCGIDSLVVGEVPDWFQSITEISDSGNVFSFSPYYGCHSTMGGHECNLLFVFDPANVGTYTGTFRVKILTNLSRWIEFNIQIQAEAVASLPGDPNSPTNPTDPDEPDDLVIPKHIEPCNCTRKERGSIIDVDSLTFGESISISGTPFSLFYSSEFSAAYSTPSPLLNRNASFNPEGWSISHHHFYDINAGRIYFGSGRSMLKESSPHSVGELRVVDGESVYVFSSTGRHLRTLTSLLGATKYSFEYDSFGRLTKVIDSYSRETLFKRSNGLLVEIEAPYGQITTIGTNAQGLISSVTNNAQENFVISYLGSSDLITSIVYPGGKVSAVAFDERGRLKATNVSRKGWRYSLVGDGDVGHDALYTVQTSASGRQWKFNTDRDQSGRYTRIEKKPTGEIVSYQENLDQSSTTVSIGGEVRTYTDQDPRFGSSKNYTSYSNESKAGLSKVSSYFEYVENLSANPFIYDSLTKYTSVNERDTQSQFIRSNRTETTTSASGLISYVKIDEFEKPVEYRWAQDLPVLINYDSHGRPLKLSQGTRNISQYTYNVNGYLSSIENGVGNITQYLYDLNGRVASEIRPDSSAVAYQYDFEGKLKSLTPVGRPMHQFEYDIWGALKSYSPPVLSNAAEEQTVYAYDLDKNVTSIKRPDYAELKFSYSTDGRLDKLSSGFLKQTYKYVSKSDLILSEVSFDGVKSDYSYIGDLLEKIKQSYKGETLSNISYEYDNYFRVKARTLSAPFLSKPHHVKYQYDIEGRLSFVGDMQISYDAISGRTSSTQLGNVSEHFSYDSYGDLQGYEARYNNVAFYSYAFVRDNNGRIIQKTETQSGKTNVYNYAYDALSRLQQVKKNGFIEGEYQYDGNGNRTSGTHRGLNFSATFDNQDRIVSSGSSAYSYNKNGDLISIDRAPLPATKLKYSSLGRLKGYSSSSANTDYVMDSNQRRVIKYESSKAVEQNIYEGELRIISRFNHKERTAKIFVHGRHVNTPEYMVYKNGLYKYITDHLGSPRVIIDVSTGKVIQVVEYDVWGATLVNSNPELQPYGFAGGVLEMGGDYLTFGARIFDPETGRWTSKDPILFGGGDTNLYGYVENDPVNWIDVEGESKNRPVQSRIPDAGGGGGARGGSGSGISPTTNCPNVNPSLSPKIQSQMQQRNWDVEKINQAISTPGMPATGKNGPATRYVNPGTGQSIVIDNATGEIFHVGGPGYKY